jgi:hypothetical protein
MYRNLYIKQKTRYRVKAMSKYKTLEEDRFKQRQETASVTLVIYKESHEIT